MPVNPIAQAILDVYNALPPPEAISVEAARARSRQMALLAPRGPDVGGVEEGIARCPQAELPVRVYLPTGATFSPRPVIVYFHGGGAASAGFAASSGVSRRPAACDHSHGRVRSYAR